MRSRPTPRWRTQKLPNSPLNPPTGAVARLRRAAAPLSSVARHRQTLTSVPTAEHEQIWEVQQKLDFPGTVYGLSRDAAPRERMTRQAQWYGAHRDDRIAWLNAGAAARP